MMQPPGRIEQLNNFQDSIQSPDGLDRLRALQYIEQALPSSQGLSGMPQVTVPTPQMQPQVPMMNRAYGGEIGTGGLVGVAEDGTQIFDNSQEGALNRATHGGVLEGFNFTPSTGGTATATATTPSSTPITTNSLDAPGTLAAGGDTGASTGLRPPTSNYNYLDIPDTLYPASKGAQTTQRMPDGTIPFDLYTSKMPVTFGQGFDLKDVPYLTANRMAQDAGADRFVYNEQYAGTADLPDDYDVGILGTQVYRDDQLDRVNYTGTQMGQGPGPVGLASNPNSEFAMKAKGYTTNPYTQQLEYSPSNTLNRRVAAAALVPTQAGVQMQYKHGGQITARAGGGQIDPAQAAQGLASFGRNGDSMLLHIQPEELDGLASLGQITYNPVTGLPEAFSFKSIFKAVKKLAPIALAIAAPYAFGASTALGIGASSAFGSFAGNLIAGAKPKDALKAGLMSGLFAGGGAYLGGASSGFGSSTAQAGAAGTTGAVTTTNGLASYGGSANPVTAGSSLTRAGLSNSAGYGGINKIQGPPQVSQFTNKIVNTAGAPSYGGTQTQPLQLAPQQGTYVSPQASQTYGGSFTPDVQAQPATITTGPEMQANQVQQFNQQLDTPEGNFTTVGEAPVGNQLLNQSQGTYVNPNAELEAASQAQLRGPNATSIFEEGGMSGSNLKRMGQDIYRDYANPKGIAKLVAMDLSTPDYEAQYAAEAAAKNRQLTDAGYTVETGFDGQTVIRDSTGVVMPRNLTVQDILDRALGKQKRTNLVARTDYRESTPEERAAMEKSRLAQGGLISLKHGGEFSGMVPGDGHGMEDNVYMPIVEKGHGSQVGTLAVSPSEYVVDSYTMAALGNGNADAGAKVMDNVVKRVRKKAYGDTKQPNEISGLQALEPMIERV